jgi:hypothetical protein
MFGHFATQPTVERKLFDMFAPGVGYVSVQKPDGKQGIGTCFHIALNVKIVAIMAMCMVPLLQSNLDFSQSLRAP